MIKIICSVELDKGTNAYQLICNEELTGIIQIQRYVDRKTYKEGEDFKVINNGSNSKLIIFNNELDRSSTYTIFIEIPDRD